MTVWAAKAVGATERWRLEGNSPVSPSSIPVATTLAGSAPGEARCPISFLFRYGDVWTDWRTTTSYNDVSKEETLELYNEDIVSMAGYSGDEDGSTFSLQAETSAGRSWGPHGSHYRYAGSSLRSSPATSNGLRLNHISGDQTKNKGILRWLLQYNQIKTWMIVCIVYIHDLLCIVNGCLPICCVM